MKDIYVTSPSMPSFEEYCNEIRPLWGSKVLTNSGEKHDTFKEKLIKYLSVDNIELFCNGHLALESIISAYNFPKGSEVITTPFTFVSTTHAIIRSGLKPVFCDINEEDYTIDVEKIEKLITKNTVAILPVHVYGNICNFEAIDVIAKKYNLKVIFDAAHAFGVRVKDVGVANFGDASIFSFHATKVFNTIEGGAVSYRELDIGKKLSKIKNFGFKNELQVDFIGGNAKMNEFQAAMGICNLLHIDKEIEKRKNVYTQYVNNLQNISGIKINRVAKDVKSNYAYFPILISRYKYTREQIYNKLRENGIFSRRYFFPLTSDFECYSDFDCFNSSKTPIANFISNNILTLPMYADLTNDEIDRICELIVS